MVRMSEVMVQKEKPKEDITTVQMKVKTRARLDKLGDIHKETYDDIISRIIDYYEKEKISAKRRASD